MYHVDVGYLPKEHGLLHQALWGEAQPGFIHLTLVLTRNLAPPDFPQDMGAANTTRTLATRGTEHTYISKDMALP